MSETVKYRNFCAEPIDNKPISTVPGVGPAAVEKFRAKNITTAWQLYQQLEKLNFDLRRFQVWLKINCPGAKGEYIHKALMESRRQFYENQGNPPPQAGTSAGRGRGARGGRSSRGAEAAGRRRTSVAADRTPQRNGRLSMSGDAPHTENALQLFFASFADSCRNILPRYHNAMKMEILGIVGKYEDMSRESGAAAAPAAEPQPSTSQAHNGA